MKTVAQIFEMAAAVIKSNYESQVDVCREIFQDLVYSLVRQEEAKTNAASKKSLATSTIIVKTEFEVVQPLDFIDTMQTLIQESNPDFELHGNMQKCFSLVYCRAEVDELILYDDIEASF